MARTAKLTCEIWCLDPELTLERIQELQRMTYYEPIAYLTDRNDLSAYEKTLMQRWDINPQIHTYTIQAGNNIRQIRYYTGKGIYETAFPATQAIIDDFVLPKAHRVTEHSVNAIFLENNARVYAIIYGSSSISQIRTILMGGGQRHRRRREWGNIEHKVHNYSLESDFFYWMFHKKQHNTTISTIYGNVDIIDIEGIGRYTERRQQTIRAVGANTIGELSNKTALGVSQAIEVTDFAIVAPTLNVITGLYSSSECLLDIIRSQMINPVNGNFESIIGNEVSFLLQLYLQIIPGLIQAYNTERTNNTWSPPHAAQAKREWSFEVIRELVALHRISEAELLRISGYGR